LLVVSRISPLLMLDGGVIDLSTADVFR
jgi:hypothetical protein